MKYEINFTENVSVFWKGIVEANSFEEAEKIFNSSPFNISNLESEDEYSNGIDYIKIKKLN